MESAYRGGAKTGELKVFLVLCNGTERHWSPIGSIETKGREKRKRQRERGKDRRDRERERYRSRERNRMEGSLSSSLTRLILAIYVRRGNQPTPSNRCGFSKK